ncbi:MAG TPA: hypothetical protein VN522_11960 [Solirubrobacterales bacterium]|nr:hypothetical protein [Solirubrobacterales bacterium]
MPYSATAYRLLISAPGDVSESDIRTVNETIAHWNAGYGREFGSVVVPIHWGANSVAEHGERPQASLNTQLVASADIVVALFWHRLGSETGVAESGTVEEIEEAQEQGAYVGILHCTRDYPQDKIDPEQLQKLAAFFERVRQNSLTLDYGDDHDLARHVEAIVNRAITYSGTRAEAAAERPAEGGGTEVWPRVESSGGNGKWKLVLANTGNEAAHNVAHRFELDGEGRENELPLELSDDEALETLAPRSDARYGLALHMGVAAQVRCVVSWEDAAGEHENSATVRFF